MDSIIYEVVSFLFLFIILLLFYIIKNINIKLGKIILICAQIIILLNFIIYIKNNEILDLGTIMIYLVNQAIVLYLFYLLKNNNIYINIYKELQKKPYLNVWITDFNNVGDCYEYEIIEFIKDIRKIVKVLDYKNICFFVYSEEEGYIEYSIVSFGRYEIKEFDLDTIEVVEKNVYKKGIVYQFRKQLKI